jgi:hypothetical protein
VVVLPAHQSSNPRFDICVSHKGGIFIQWEATFPSTAKRLYAHATREKHFIMSEKYERLYVEAKFRGKTDRFVF